MWYVCTINYCSAIKKKDLMPFMATRMDPETVMLNEIDREAETTYNIPYMGNLNRHDANKLIYKAEHTHQLRE